MQKIICQHLIVGSLQNFNSVFHKGSSWFCWCWWCQGRKRRIWREGNNWCRAPRACWTTGKLIKCHYHKQLDLDLKSTVHRVLVEHIHDWWTLILCLNLIGFVFIRFWANCKQKEIILLIMGIFFYHLGSSWCSWWAWRPRSCCTSGQWWCYWPSRSTCK